MREEDVSAARRPRRRIYLGKLRQVLQRARFVVALNGALLPQADRGGGAP